MTVEDNRNAAFDIARLAKRSLSIWSRDLEPEVFDRIEFIDIVKNLILTHKYARVRILLVSPLRSVSEGNRLVEMARGFSSFMEIRLVHADYQQRPEAFMVADQHAYLHRPIASRYEGIADDNKPSIAVGYVQFFDSVWNKSESASELRRLHL